MMLKSKWILGGVFFVLSVVFQTHAAQYTFYLKVLAPEVRVYTSTNGSQVMGKAKQNQVYKILKKEGEWIGIEVKTRQGSKFGWVQAEPGTFKILRKSITTETPTPKRRSQPRQVINSRPSSSMPPQKKPQRSSSSNAFSDPSTGLRLFGGPVYNIKDYLGSNNTTSSSSATSGSSGSTSDPSLPIQWRVGMSLYIPLSSKFYLGLPILFTTGQSFQTVSGGLHGMFYFWNNGKLGTYAKFGVVYEYLFADIPPTGKSSFHAANVDVGLGLDVMFNDKIGIGIEPLSIQTMVFKSFDGDVSMPMRGQVLVSGKFNF